MYSTQAPEKNYSSLLHLIWINAILFSWHCPFNKRWREKAILHTERFEFSQIDSTYCRYIIIIIVINPR